MSTEPSAQPPSQPSTESSVGDATPTRETPRTIVDERHGLEYVVLIVLGEDRSRRAGSEGVHVERLRVVEVRRLADDGTVSSRDTSPEVRHHEPRVWRLLEDDRVLLEDVESAGSAGTPETDLPVRDDWPSQWRRAAADRRARRGRRRSG